MSKRKLTPAEIKRKKHYETQTQRLKNEGYIEKKLTVSVLYANVMAIVLMLPVIIIFVFINYTINPFSVDINLFALILGMILFTIIHELIHGLFWGIFAKNHFHDIEFGVIWQMLTPYCTCKSPLTKAQYIIGAAMPTVWLGFIPAIIGVFFGLNTLFFISMIMIFGGGGDATIICKLIGHKKTAKHTVYLDHPYEVGLVVFEK